MGPGYLPNDIAVIELPTVELGDNVAAISMARSGSVHAGNSECWITGWGVTSIGNY